VGCGVEKRVSWDVLVMLWESIRDEYVGKREKKGEVVCYLPCSRQDV
jgi:hypothetical protein